MISGLHAVSDVAVSGISSITPSGGPTTHSTSGTLQAQTAHVTGSASNFTVHASSGTLQAQVAGIVGSASNFTVHSSVGVLQTQGALVSGNADHVVSGTTHVTSGSLVSGQSSVSGVSQHNAKHITSGTLQSGSAVVSGVSQHKAKHNSSGALLAGSSIIVGSASKSFGTTLPQASCIYSLYSIYEAQIDNILIYPQKCSYPGLSQKGGARFIEYWIME